MYEIKLLDREILMNVTEAFEELKQIIKDYKNIDVQLLLQEISKDLKTLCDNADKQS